MGESDSLKGGEEEGARWKGVEERGQVEVGRLKGQGKAAVSTPPYIPFLNHLPKL
jgi:hypothetical protein